MHFAASTEKDIHGGYLLYYKTVALLDHLESKYNKCHVTPQSRAKHVSIHK